MGKAAGEPMSVVTALVRSSFLVNAVYAEAAREYGLTPQQGQLLCVLMAQPYGMGDLGAVLGLAKSSLTGLVDRCAQRGLVRREPDPLDGRAVRIVLTDEGGTIAEEFYAETCRRVEGLPAGLSGDDRGRLAGLLGRVVRENKVPEVFGEPGESVEPTELVAPGESNPSSEPVAPGVSGASGVPSPFGEPGASGVSDPSGGPGASGEGSAVGQGHREPGYSADLPIPAGFVAEPGEGSSALRER